MILRPARTLVLTAILASCAPSTPPCTGTECMPPPPPTDRPARLGTPLRLGATQWTLLVYVDALAPGDTSWFDQLCTDDVAESDRRQQLFAARLDTTLTSVIQQNPHCTLTSVMPLTYGHQGCEETTTSNLSGAYTVFTCANGEPLVVR